MTDYTFNDLIPVVENQLDSARQCLARAFQDDPAPSYMIPDYEKRKVLLPELYYGVVRYAHQYDLIQTLADTTRGVSLWMKPGSVNIPVHKMIKSGLLTAYLKVGISRLGRALNYLNFAEAQRIKIVPGRHWYLFMIGVDPAYQNQGIGSRLLTPVLAQADKEGLPVYLDTFNEKTLAFYRKHSFTIAEEALIPNGGPRGWFLLRQPQ
jgi:ribosomal protein S18 acetylase RimI-like enzyme